MKINVGNNNKIKNSTIGNNNNKEDKENKVVRIFIEVIVGIIITLLSAYIVYKFGWNK